MEKTMSIDQKTLDQLLAKDDELYGADQVRQMMVLIWQQLLSRIGTPPYNFTTLTPETLNQIANQIALTPDPKLNEFCLEQWKNIKSKCLYTYRQNQQKDIFQHFLLYRIETYLAPEGQPHIAGKTLSRSILMGFNEAIPSMMGTNMYQHYYDQARHLIAKIANRADAKLAWDEARKDPAVWQLTRDILIEIANWFAEPIKRYRWFNQIMETHHNEQEHASPEWYFEPIDFALLCWGLFGEFFMRQQDTKFQQYLTQTYERQKINELKQALTAIEHYMRTAQNR
ncbi:MAG: hypothetical protein AAF403_01890 [Pseudomonadota bacterium]